MDWPSTLPQSPLIDGFDEQAPKTAIRTEMEQGPAKTRQRLTANVRLLTWPTILTTAQVATLDTFFNTTTGGGSLPFNITHPRTSAVLSARIVEEPTYEPVSHNRWLVELQLEILPSG